MSQLFLTESKNANSLNVSKDHDHDDWSFADKTFKDTSYITHGYYTYPAKFIPQLAARLINKYSCENEIVIDPFMGSGTTIVEAIVNNRLAIGTDINEIAILISKVKSTPISSNLLENEYNRFMGALANKWNNDFENELKYAKRKIFLPERVDYWFKPYIKDKLIVILNHTLQIKNQDIKDFFLLAFSQILKSCSIWLQKSVKPTRDTTKKDNEPIKKMEWQLKKMIKSHQVFNNILANKVRHNINQYRKIVNNDARNLPCENEQASLIVTSPPYVTSYEYADLHQLPSLWFGYLEQLPIFRKKFIGSSYREKKQTEFKSKIGEQIVSQLKNKKKQEVTNYFSDMLESFLEMKRVLKRRGKVAIVIGNTKFQGVDILNTEVFKEQFENIDFAVHDIIEREIPAKMLPSTRDPKTGRFTKVTDCNKSLIYPTETILIMEKK